MKVEKDMIAALMVSSENVNNSIEFGLTSEWFYDPMDRGVAEILIDAANAGKTWSITTSAAVVASFGIFEKYPNACEYECPKWAFDAVSMEEAFDLIRVSYQRRRLQAACSETIMKLSAGEDPEEVLNVLASQTEAISCDSSTKERHVSEIAEDLIELDEKVISGQPVGLPFPWKRIQKHTHGIPLSSYTALYGRDGKGKSRLATYLAQFWARNGVGVLVFPFEDTELRYLRNFSASYGEYDAFHLNSGMCSERYISRHKESVRRSAKLPLYICDYADTINRIISTIAMHSRKYGIKAVVIDGLKDISSSGRENRTQEEDNIVRALTSTARKYGLAIIGVGHINKIDNDKWMFKNNITGSGNWTKSARMVMALQDYIPDDVKQNVAPDVYDDNLMILDVQKCSYGKMTMEPLIKDLEMGRFYSALEE